jgi:hypothetical protein
MERFHSKLVSFQFLSQTHLFGQTCQLITESGNYKSTMFSKYTGPWAYTAHIRTCFSAELAPFHVCLYILLIANWPIGIWLIVTAPIIDHFLPSQILKFH